MHVEKIIKVQPVINHTKRWKYQSETEEAKESKLDYATLFTEDNQDGSSIEKAKPSENYAKVIAEKACSGVPYAYLSDDYGKIIYNGVTFTCNYGENALCLGNMNNQDEVLRIPLSGGGCLKVNRNNINELSSAIGMFSAEDVKRILDAIAMDTKTQNKVNEMEQNITKTYETMSKGVT